MWTQINSLPAFSSPQTRRAISSAQIRRPRLRMSNSIIWYRESISSPLNAVICGFDFSNELKDACQKKTSATTSLSSSMR